MPYKDPEKAREAKRRHYHENKDKFRERNRDKRSKVRKLIQEAKTDVPCADCGIIYPYYIMDFDHLPGFIKNFTIANGSRNLELLAEEIAKCEVVCSNCHRQRSWDRLNGSTSREMATALVLKTSERGKNSS